MIIEKWRLAEDLPDGQLDGISKVLGDLGWTPSPHGAMCKVYETAVGPKQAVLRLLLKPNRAWVQAQYFSEGRNVCESCGFFVEIGDEPGLASALKTFNADVDRQVLQSYAARLYHAYGVRDRPASAGRLFNLPKGHALCPAG